jgi:hypothetical protein
MKTQWLLGIALCGAGLVAQAQQQDESVTVQAPRLTIDLPDRPYNIAASELREFRGSYELANGQILRLSGVGKAMYGEIDELGEHRLVPSNHNTFVALDRKLQVRIDREQYGEPGGEVLMVVPSRNLATGEIVEQVVRLAAR